MTSKSTLPKIFFVVSALTLLVIVYAAIQRSSKKSEPLFKGEASLFLDSGEKKVVIDEYSDFQCPACRRAFPVLKELKENYPNKIEFNYHHFPLSYHQWSKKAAEASEAAREQGKFWPYHDMLFEKQSEWEKSKDAVSLFKKYASDLKLDGKKFEEDLDSGKFASVVEEDYEEGERKKVDATPTIFVNGKKVSGFKNWEEFKAKIEEQIK